MPKLYDKLVLNQGLVLDLDFVEGTGSVAVDKSKSHAHGAFGAGGLSPTWAQLPSGIWTLTFDGNDNILLPNVAALEGATGTIIIGLRVGLVGVAQYLYSQNVDEWSLYDNGGEFRLYYDMVGVYDWVHGLSVGDDVHIAFTFGPGITGRGYQNGVQRASGMCSAVAPTPGTKRIGSNSTAVSEWFIGSLFFFLQYNRVLSATEILEDYLIRMRRYQ